MSDLSGRIGGLTAGYDLHAAWNGTRRRGDDVRLTVREEHVTGRFSGRLDGKDVDLTLGSVPRELAALAAVCACKALEDEQTSAAATAAATS